MMSSHAFRPYLLILCLLAGLGIFSTSLYLPSMPAIGEDLNATQHSIQLTLTLFFLGSSIGYIFLGPLADRIGRLLTAKIGLILFIGTSFLCALSPDVQTLQIGRFLQGFFASTGPLIARAVGRDLYEGAALTRFSATIMMVISLSPAVAPALGGFIEQHFGWEKNFYFLMLFGGVSFCLVWAWLPETNAYKSQTKIRETFKNYLGLLKNPYYMALCFIMGIQIGCIFCYLTFSPFLFISFFKWSAQEYGYVGMAAAAGNITGFTFARQMAHRIPFHVGILAGGLTCFLLSILLTGVVLLNFVSAFIILLYSFCFCAASSVTVVNASAAAMNLYARIAGLSAALMGAIQIGGGAFGSSIASFLPDSTLILGFSMSGLSFLSLCLALFVGKKAWLGR